MLEVEEVIEAWGLGEVMSIEEPRRGSMNETWLVETAVCRVVLRRHRVPNRSAVECEHRVIAHVANAEIPVPRLISTPTDEQILDRDGHLYSLYSFASGVQVDRADLTVAHAQAMGSMLGELHLVLRSFDAGPPEVEERRDRDETIAGIDRIVRVIKQRGDSRTEASTLDYLKEWGDWLRTVDLGELEPLVDVQAVHGDYQETNLFFSEDLAAVSAVIDWDKHRTHSRAFEIVRAIHHGLYMRPELAHAFVDAYRTVAPLPSSALAAGARHFGRNQAQSLWLFEEIYLAHNDRVALRKGEEFRPFDEAWRELQLS